MAATQEPAFFFMKVLEYHGAAGDAAPRGASLVGP